MADSAFAAVRDFYFTSRYGQRRGEPGICDFTFGNPHEMPLEGLVTALRARVAPKDNNWFAYKTSEEEPQAFLAQQLRLELALPFEPADIALTTGAFAAITRAAHPQTDHSLRAEQGWTSRRPQGRKDAQRVRQRVLNDGRECHIRPR